MAIEGFGTLLQIGDGGTPTEAFTTIAEVTNISGPGLSMDTIDITYHGATGAWRQFIAGLKDAGEVTFSINFMPASTTHSYTAGLLNDYNNRTQRNFRLQFTDAGPTQWILPCLITNFEPGEPIDNQVTADVTLKVVGAPTLA